MANQLKHLWNLHTKAPSVQSGERLLDRLDDFVRIQNDGARLPWSILLPLASGEPHSTTLMDEYQLGEVLEAVADTIQDPAYAHTMLETLITGGLKNAPAMMPAILAFGLKTLLDKDPAHEQVRGKLARYVIDWNIKAPKPLHKVQAQLDIVARRVDVRNETEQSILGCRAVAFDYSPLK